MQQPPPTRPRPRFRPRVPLAWLSLLVVAAPLAAQQRQGASPPPFVFEAGETEMLALVRRCENYLQYNVLVDEFAMKALGAGGPVSFERPVVVDRDGCEDMLSSLLWRRGLLLVPVDEPKDVFEVLVRSGPRAREIGPRAVFRTAEQVLARPGLYRSVTTSYVLRHTRAQLANNALRPFLAMMSNNQPGDCVVLGNAGNEAVLLLAGPQALVAEALRMLQAIDVEASEGAIGDLFQRLKALEEQNRELLARVQALEAPLPAKARRGGGAGDGR